MMLGVLVSKIGAARFPIDQELILEALILDPIKMHVGCLQSLLFDRVVGKDFRNRVIDTDRGERLLVEKLSKGGLNWYGFLEVDEGSPDVSFSC